MVQSKVQRRVSLLTLLLSTVSPAIAQEKPDIVTLEPIIVSGEIIGRDWLDTGTSAERLDEEDLENRPALDNVRDILEDTVNVMVPTGAAKAPTIRGVDGTGPAENANAFFAGSRARLGLRIDGRPAGYNELVFGNAGLWDVESVEVLRGPQSTLVGRNAVAGTVVIKTKDPTFDYSGALEASVGNYQGRQFAGMVNLPIAEDLLAVRIAGEWQSSESAVGYEPFPGASNPGDIESINVRGKILAHPNIGEDSTLRLTVAHSSYEGPQGEIIVRPFDNRYSNFPQQPVHKPSTTSISGEFEVDLDDHWRLELDTSFTDFKFDRKTSPGSSNAGIDTLELSVDPRVRYSADNGVDILVGAHLYKSRQDEFIEFVALQNFDDKVDTYALYGEAVIPVTDSVDVSLGARYEYERHRRNGGDAAGAVATIDSDRSFRAFLPKFGLNWQPSRRQSYGFHISKGYNAGGGGISVGTPVPFPVIHYQYDEETVWNYEVYGRQKLMNGRLQLTQNVFFSRYKDMQLPFDLTPLDTRDEAFVVRNADAVTTYGAELGASFDLTENLNLFGNIGLLKTDITDYPASGVEGNELFGAPSLTGNAGFTWQYGGFKTSFSARYSDGYFTDINNRPRGKVDPYIVADAHVSYQFNNIRVFGEVKNLFNSDSAVAFYPGATTADDTAVLLQPLTFRIGTGIEF